MEAPLTTTTTDTLKLPPLHLHTPLLESITLSKDVFGNENDVKVWLKMDVLQPTGSFKIRGIGNHCNKKREQGITHFICSSGGNAGKSVAYAARKLGVKATIVMPTIIPLETKRKIEMEGAEVIYHGSIWEETDILAREIAEKVGPEGYIHPFDHEYLWEGHATMVEEVYKDFVEGRVNKPDVVVCCVGGGGMLAGLSRGLEKVGWGDIPIIATETRGAHKLNLSFQEGKLSELDKVTSVAKTLATKSVCQEAWDRCIKTGKVISALVNDKEAIESCLRFVNDERVLVEPSCGASLAVVYNKLPELMNLNPKNILVIVCGGNNTSIESLQSLLKSVS
eukprot:gene2476-3063_t